jgi:hypothetical protein
MQGSRALRLSAAALALAALALPAGAQDAGGLEHRFEDLKLTVHFPPELHMADRVAGNEQGVQASWGGKLGASDLRARLVLIPRSQYDFDEPSQVVDMIGDDLANPQSGGHPDFHYDKIVHVQGPYGWASYATLAHSKEQDVKGEYSEVLRLGGLLEDWGYSLEVRAKPDLAAADEKALEDALTKGVSYDGEQRDPKWTDEEATTRWKTSVPDELKEEMEDVMRTAHYVILTNSSGGKQFAKKMEECYTAIRKVYPFDDVAGRRLMPVFLFRTNDQYYAFLGKAIGWSVEQAKRSQGVAFGDLYTTWYEAPGDPVHIHEATHQIFRNRLELDGGGSWFQEGVAEYMSTKANERGMAARAEAKGKAVPLLQFVQVESLLMSAPAEDTKGEDQAGNQYEQAALIIEFARESKWGKAKFLDWVHAIGAAPSNNVAAIQAAMQRTYGVDIAGFDAELVKYCAKR